ncbi:MAG: heavy metal-responsive transcriptional regulator [Acidobacteria bacterium]|nr:heavy metal-responsive transcriptional regulator [Acidobacteriota bacterium]
MKDRPSGFRPTELARAAGVSTDTLRHYESLGVLAKAPRTSSGYRVYPGECLDRVKTVRHALRLGFTLAELAEILRSRDRGGAPCKRVLDMLQDKLASLENEINELVQLRKYVQQIVGDWQSKLGQSELGRRAHLLNSLGAAPVPEIANGNLQRRRKRP